jgi:D-alanine-D-alanine ligase
MRGVLNLAERAAKALGVDGACRVDLLVTEGENEYVLEANTNPGMTETSLLPKIAAAAGYDFGSLCEAIVNLAKLHIARPQPLADLAPISVANDAARTSTVPVSVPRRAAVRAR